MEIDSQSLIAEADDIIMTRTGETRGKVLTGYRGVFHNNTFRLNYDKGLVVREYLIYWLESLNVQEFITHRSGRSAQPDLTHKAFGPCPFAMAPREEQEQIVRRVAKLFALADRLEARFVEGQKRADSITQSVLAKAFSGELVPTEYELAKAEGRSFESAEELVERIKRSGTAQKQDVKRHRKSHRLTPIR